MLPLGDQTAKKGLWSAGGRPAECLFLLSVVRCLPLTNGVTGAGGTRRTSLRGGNRGGIGFGGGARSVYGDLTAAGWLSSVAGSAAAFPASSVPFDSRTLSIDPL